MFVHPLRPRALGVAIGISGALALGACSDPTFFTDLRPEGPPDVLTVLAANDPATGLENSIYCKVGDDKRPSMVGSPAGFVPICPADLTMGSMGVTDADPLNPYVRIMFDELLDASIERLDPILDPDTMQPTGTFSGSLADSQPVNFTCGGMPVAYDGYYSPNGNAFTWPLGPSLVIIPDDPTAIAAGSSCSVTLKSGVVKDKSGIASPDSEAFTFSVAALAFTGSDPKPAALPANAATIAADSPLTLLFNGFADPASLTPADVIIKEVANCAATTGTVVPAIIGGDPGAITVGTTGTSAAPEFTPNKSYLVTFAPGASVTDLAGGTLALPASFSVCFSTEP